MGYNLMSRLGKHGRYDRPVIGRGINMKRLCVCLVILVAATAPALDVAENELETIENTSVEFVNYEGPHRKIETAEEIEAIGLDLGRNVDSEFAVYDYAGKYRIIHAVDPSATTGLDADIFLILGTAEVDHIDNVRLILKGFLKSGYGYTDDDGALLAEFVTIYNAVYRKEIDYYAGKYKRIVMENVTAETVGMATVYSEWPGRTQIVIPLTDGATEGGVGSLDTDALTEQPVIDQMREQDDRGLQSRKDITELKEREVEEEQRKIEQESEALEEEQQEIASERERLEEEREELARERQEAEQAGDQEAAERVAQREAEVAGAEEDLSQREEEAVAKEEELAQRETEQQERVERIQEEREEIAEDERELVGQDAAVDQRTTATATSAAALARAVMFLKQRRIADEVLGQLLLIDIRNGSVISESALNTIRNREYHEVGNSIVAIAGTTGGQAAVRLVKMNRDTLQVTAESDVDVFPDSRVAVNGSHIYVVTEHQDSYRLARFDDSLLLRQRSDEDVLSVTNIVVADSELVLQRPDGKIIRLDAESLEKMGELD